MNDLARYQSPAQAIPYADMEKMAAVIANSGLFGMKNPSQALALMLVAQSEGLHPATAARDYHVIQGRPALKADAMLARFQAAGGKVEWHEYTDKVCSATFSHPSGGKVRVEWTIEMARAAGLAGKDVWKQFPRPMLRSRVVSEGIRTVYPAVLCGMYTPEEVSDMAEVQGSAETTGPDIKRGKEQNQPDAKEWPALPALPDIRYRLALMENAAAVSEFWQSLRLDNEHPRFQEIRGEFSAARKRIEGAREKRVPLNPAPGKKATAIDGSYDIGKSEAALYSMPDHGKRAAWLEAEKERMGWNNDSETYLYLIGVVEEMVDEKKPSTRKPLNPAPGKKATPESLAAAGYGDGDPAPFDDELEL